MGKFPLTNVPRSRASIKIERLARNRDEAREALVLAVAGVTSIMPIANLILMILY